MFVKSFVAGAMMVAGATLLAADASAKTRVNIGIGLPGFGYGGGYGYGYGGGYGYYGGYGGYYRPYRHRSYSGFYGGYGYGGYGGGYGYSAPYPYYNDYSYRRPRYYNSYGISCGQAKRILRNYGWYNLRANDCNGRNYSFYGVKKGRGYLVTINSVSGAIVGSRRY